MQRRCAAVEQLEWRGEQASQHRMARSTHTEGRVGGEALDKACLRTSREKAALGRDML
jgi:hypothetical protein